jgi:hypothetical protein
VPAAGQVHREAGAVCDIRRAGLGKVAAQDGPVQIAQFGSGVGAEFAGEPLAHPAVPVQGLGVAAGQVQRPHQQRHQGFDQGVFAGQVGQRADHRGRVARPELELCPTVDHGQAFLLQALADPGGPFAGQAVERRPAPEVQRLLEQGQPFRIRLGVGALHHHAEQVQVDPFGFDVEDVAGGAPGERTG